MSEAERTVIVTNLSSAVGDQNLREFFSFCGDIQLIMNGLPDPSDPERKSFAAIKFKLQSSANTALLLSNALIVDRPVIVSLATADDMAAHLTLLAEKLADKKHEDASSGNRGRSWSLGLGRTPDNSGRGFLSGIVAQTKQNVQKAMDTVKEVDEAMGVSRGMNSIKDQTRQNAAKVQHAAHQATTKTRDQVKAVDTKIGLTRGMAAITEQTRQNAIKIRDTTAAGAGKLQQNTKATLRKTDDLLGFTEAVNKTQTQINSTLHLDTATEKMRTNLTRVTQSIDNTLHVTESRTKITDKIKTAVPFGKAHAAEEVAGEAAPRTEVNAPAPPTE